MNVSRLRSVIAGRPMAFLTALGFIVGVVMVATFLMPPRYVGVAQVLVHTQPQASFQGNPVGNEADLMRSERVSIAALRLLGLQDDPQLAARWRDETGGLGSFESWAAAYLTRTLDVKPGRESNMLTLAYGSRDPELAARAANAFLRAYMSVSAQIRAERQDQLAGSFDRNTTQLKRTLDAAEAKLAAYQRQHNMTTTDERFDIEALRLSELNSQLVAAQAAATTAAGRNRQRAHGATQEQLADPLVSSLSASLAAQESKLAEMSTRMGSEHPGLAEQRNTIEALRERVREATLRAGSVTLSESRVAAERAAGIQAALDAQRMKVLESKARRDTALQMQREVELARKAYDAAIIRMNETAAEGGAGRSSTSIVREATVPALPAFPRPLVNLIASLVIGVLAGVAAAVWAERRDRRLRVEDDVYGLLGRPAVAVLSPGPSRRSRLALSRA